MCELDGRVSSRRVRDDGGYDDDDEPRNMASSPKRLEDGGEEEGEDGGEEGDEGRKMREDMKGDRMRKVQTLPQRSLIM